MKPPPKLAVRFRGDRAYCARPGCEEYLGASRAGVLRLEHTEREGWVLVDTPRHPYGNDPGGTQDYPFLYARRRRRRANPLTGGPVNAIAAEAMNGEIVECPKCRTHQMVALSR